MQIRKLDTTRKKDVHQFIRFPFALYRDSPLWVPPFWPEMTAVMDRSKHPFYAHSKADFFVAEENGETLGRIAVMDNRNYNRYHQRAVSFFYYFDAIDDEAVARSLFDAASDWAQHAGLNLLVGPKGMLQGDGIGMLVEGFEHRPAMGIAYNYDYYPRLVSALGFEKETDFLSGYLAGKHVLPARYQEVAAKVSARRGLSIKSFASEKELRQWIDRIGQVYNDAFVANWEYAPITPAEMKIIADRLLSISDPRLIKLVMKGDDIVGFVFAFPDISAGIQKARGRIWPIGWFFLLREFKRTRWVNFNGLGLLPAHQGSGGTAILFSELAKTAEVFDFEHADVVQVEEGNAKSQAEMATIGVRWYKRHRVFRRAI